MNTFSLLLRDFDKRSKVESAKQSNGTSNERSDIAPQRQAEQGRRTIRRINLVFL